jgi:hypothetical protein
VTVPQYAFLWSDHDEVNHHVRRYSLHELRALFRSCEPIFSCGFNSILLGPIAIHRLCRELFSRLIPGEKKRNRSDFQRSWFPLINRFLELLLRSESLWLNRGIGPSFGVSAMLICRRCDRSLTA